MTTTLNIVSSVDESSILFSLNDPTGTYSGLYGSATTKLSTQFDIGSPTLKSTTVTPQDIDATFSAFSQRATATMKGSLYVAASSYDNLLLAVGTLSNYLTQGCVMNWVQGGNSYLIDVLPSETPALLNGQELAIYEAGALFQTKIPLSIERQPYLRMAGLTAASNILSNPTMLRDSNGDGAPDSWTLGTFFDPSSVTGLVAWYDFSDISTLWQDTARTSAVSADAQSIKGVTDKSGQSSHLSEATNPPTYKTAILNGRSVSRFNGSNNLLTVATLTSPTKMSIFFVYTGAGSSAGDSRGVVGNTGAGGKLITRNNAIWPNDSFASMTPSPTLGTQSVLALLYDYDNDTYNVYENGAASVSDTVARTALGTTLTIGRDNNTTTFFAGDVGEVLIYNNIVSSGNRSSITSYLGTRWGISVV